MMKESLSKLLDREDLTRGEASAIMEAIMDGNATDAQIGAFLVALKMKGETVDEITGCAEAMRRKAIPVSTDREPFIDTCGTGGDGAGTFNISTTAAFVVAGAGLCVAKHGNRSVSSSCGSADLLKALGIDIEAPPERVKICLDEAGIGFLFAPTLHRAMKHAVGPRREIGVRTVFNILGPLTNPAGARRQVIGVYDVSLTDVMARVLKELGSEHVMVVYGLDRLDEISISAKTKVTELRDGRICGYYMDPGDFGIGPGRKADLAGGDAEKNARITLSVLRGERGPRRDAVILNAAAGLVVGGLAADMEDGIRMASESIDSGRALSKLELLRRIVPSRP